MVGWGVNNKKGWGGGVCVNKSFYSFFTFYVISNILRVKKFGGRGTNFHFMFSYSMLFAKYLETCFFRAGGGGQ